MHHWGSMKFLNTRKYPVSVQYIICIALVLFVSFISFYIQPIIGYRVVALVLLMTVSFIAMLFEILPVILAAVLSAFIWNFFFIPPLFTFHIDKVEDALFFFLYFFIALINTVLSFKIREAEKKARDKEEKENILKLYSTLFNSLSHELRTPISTIIGALDTLKENKTTLTEENKTELLSVIHKASFRLNREVDNLLNMNRLESGMLKLNADWCDLNELINAVIDKLFPCDNKTIAFNPDENMPFFRLDAGIIEQIIYNLLHNAIHHTPENTIIKVDVSHDMDLCIIAISDNGQGFPENKIPFVFNKFYRLPDSKTGGIGLGLSIVKGFVEAHKGKVTLENMKTGGARFIIKIPAEATYINNLKNE